tara:strand:- start:278 stop:1039 length:762 start_codon:yes stop_codon:yes gene_type:complete
MPLIRNPESNAVGFYSHIPKCAGSSIADALVYSKRLVYFHRYKQCGERKEVSKVARIYLKDYYPYDESQGGSQKTFPDEVSPCSIHHWHLELSKYYFDLSKCDYKFAVVRDPVERLISEYKFRKGAYCPISNINTWENYDLGRNCESTFKTEDFGYWLRICYEGWLLNPYIWDNHFRPQHEFVEPRFDIIPFNVDKINSYLRETVGTISGIPWVNKSDNMEVNVTQEDRQLIEEWYNRDYELFANKKDYNWIE